MKRKRGRKETPPDGGEGEQELDGRIRSRVGIEAGRGEGADFALAGAIMDPVLGRDDSRRSLGRHGVQPDVGNESGGVEAQLELPGQAAGDAFAGFLLHQNEAPSSRQRQKQRSSEQ